MIKTGSWFGPLTEDHIRIGISRGVPRRTAAGFRMYRKLQPGAWFKSVSTGEYIRLYEAEVLAPLDPRQVHDDIMRLADGRSPVLCCFEKVGTTWCHRSLTAAWLADGLGITVPELGHETLAQALHPMRPPSTLL